MSWRFFEFLISMYFPFNEFTSNSFILKSCPLHPLLGYLNKIYFVYPLLRNTILSLDAQNIAQRHRLSCLLSNHLLYSQIVSYIRYYNYTSVIYVMLINSRLHTASCNTSLTRWLQGLSWLRSYFRKKLWALHHGFLRKTYFSISNRNLPLIVHMITWHAFLHFSFKNKSS